MRDRWAIALALTTAAGALRPSDVPVVVGALVVLGALAARWPSVLCFGVALLASALAQRALDGLTELSAGPVAGEITLLTDPEPSPGGLRADARLGSRHVALEVSQATAPWLADRLAGDHILVRGQLRAIDPLPSWRIARHIGGELRVHRADPGRPAAGVAGLANRARRVLADGAAPLSEDHRALFAGLVIGDDRAQPVWLTDDFRGAGLTHLLAVSGQNVAFLLALVAPVARRLRLWPRLALSLALIGGFVVLTRAEPSVARAGAMAALAAVTITVGRPLSRVRVIAVAVTGLLLMDPLLVHALGFRLSAAAALAIVVLAPAIAAALPGPRWLAEPLAVTVAAQLGVAPFLVAAFGPLPLASVPANLLAVPAAGLVMAWGMSAGFVAGLAGGPVAVAVHLPTRVLLAWIEAVAARGAAAPLGQLDAPALVAAAVGLALVTIATPRGHRWWRGAGWALVGGVVVAAIATANAPPRLREVLLPAVVRWHAAGTEVVVLGGGGFRAPVTAPTTLEAMRRAGIDAIDLLVLADDDVGAPVVEAVAARHRTGAVLGPQDLPAEGAALEVGDLWVLLVPADGRVVVEAWPSPR